MAYSSPRRDSDTPHYQTFPTKPPTSRGKPPPPAQPTQNANNDDTRSPSGGSHSRHASPLPVRQLAVLAVIALAEQTALNSISPYLPEMASSFPEVNPSQVGMFVGLIASAFALAQFATNFFWGWLSDRIGRKPVILTGTLLTAACFVAFGFCRTLWQAVLVQALMGLVNGNQGVVPTCLGEITDRSNQSKAFQYLPVVYGLGGITGPIVGGLLAQSPKASITGAFKAYPYLPPNLLSAGVLLIDLIITMLFLEESLEEAKNLPPLNRRVANLFSWMWQFTGHSHAPSYTRPGSKSTHRHSTSSTNSNAAQQASSSLTHADYNEDDDDATSSASSRTPSSNDIIPDTSDHPHIRAKDVLNRDTILILATFLIFQLSNVAYNSLFPIFAQSTPPIGRDLTPEEIGVSLGFAGLVTIVFQVGVFGSLRARVGNKVTYRVGLLGFVVSFLLMPWVGYKGSSSSAENPSREHILLWVELGAILVVKTIAAVSGLTSALLLITNSAPSHSLLGTLNGLAQTLSAAGRAAGPFLSGSLFSLATRVRPKGEALAFGVFGGIAFVGFVLSFGIRGGRLEGDDSASVAGDEEDDDDDEEEEDDAEGEGERRSLLSSPRSGAGSGSAR